MFTFLKNYNLYLSIFLFILSLGINYYLKIENSLLVAFFLAISTFIIYNFHQKKISSLTNQSSKISFTFFLILFLILILNLKWNEKSFSLILLNFFLCIIYVFPKKIHLRKIPFLKLFLISFVWVSSLILFPLYLHEKEINWKLFLMIYLFFIIITLPFDIRDIKYDTYNIKTFPQIFNLKIIQFFLIILIVVFYLLSIQFNIFSNKNVLLSVLCVQLIISVGLLKRKVDSFNYFIVFDISLIILGLSFFFN
jgi:hypothetical protein